MEPIEQPWIDSWISPNFPGFEAEEADYIRAAPRAVQRLMVCFPPGCVVRTAPGFDLMVPFRGTCGVVRRYFTPTLSAPHGSVGVSQHPEANLVVQCLPQQLEIAHYVRGIDANAIARILGGV